MASDCITHGYLVRAASQRDGRRTIIQLTDEGNALLGHFRDQHRQAFENVTRGAPVGRLVLRPGESLRCWARACLVAAGW
jgi:hypothetical protein